MFTYSELLCMASAILLQLKSPHLPEDCDYYKELNTLYTKLVKEVANAQDNRTKSQGASI